LASSSSSFTFSRDGPPTGDFHPIYNAPMLGAHKASEHYLVTLRVTRRFKADRWSHTIIHTFVLPYIGMPDKVFYVTYDIRVG
jgi:hypothetical protein